MDDAWLLVDENICDLIDVGSDIRELAELDRPASPPVVLERV